MRFHAPLDSDLDHRPDLERLARAAASRRSFVVGAAFSGVSLNAPAAARADLTLPQQSMRLHRSLERELHDRAFVRVEREWVVEFRRKRHGIVISGYQLSARVSAPEALRPLARIEQQRAGHAFLPITLSPSGLLMDAGPLTLRSHVALAVAADLEIWSSNGLSQASPIEHIRSQLQGPHSEPSATLDHLPADLFYPADRSENTAQALQLPNGSSGEIELAIHSKSQLEQPWLDHWQREVTTRIGTSQRRSSETWSLSELS